MGSSVFHNQQFLKERRDQSASASVRRLFGVVFEELFEDFFEEVFDGALSSVFCGCALPYRALRVAADLLPPSRLACSSRYNSSTCSMIFGWKKCIPSVVNSKSSMTAWQSRRIS